MYKPIQLTCEVPDLSTMTSIFLIESVDRQRLYNGMVFIRPNAGRKNVDPLQWRELYAPH